MPGWSWFATNFAWIGAAAAVALLALLFGTTRLQADPSRSRWRDVTWLSWAGLAAYLLHNIEEYGLDLTGRLHGFPQDMSTLLHLPLWPENPIPPGFFVAVNVTAFWVAAPLAALLSRRHPLVGLTVYGILTVNILAHAVPLLAGFGYGAGTFTALALFLPLALWTGTACFGPGRFRYGALALLVAGGVLLHVVLMVPLLLFLHGRIGGPLLILLQVANPFLLMAILWAGEGWRGGALMGHRPPA